MSNKNQSVQMARAFEFYVGNIWPLHRIFVMNQIAKRCSRCAASEKMVPLGVSGICEICAKFLLSAGFAQSENFDNDEKAIDEILQRYQGKGEGQYDALILFSGGKDSTYMVRRIIDQFPNMRILTLSIDNSFMSPIAKENIETIIEKLGVDHTFVRVHRGFYVKLFRYCLTHLNSDGGYGTLDFSDGEFMLDTARNLAVEKRIPLILCGYSKYQVQNGLKLHSFESPREKELSDRKDTAGIPLPEIFTDSDLELWWRPSRRCQENVARLLFPLYAWNKTEEQIKEQVVDWGLLSHKEQSPLVTNHQLIPLLGVVDVHKFGYSSFEFEFCRMIREGKAQVMQWRPIFEFLEYTAKTGLFVKPVILDALRQLNLELKDVGIKWEAL